MKKLSVFRSSFCLVIFLITLSCNSLNQTNTTNQDTVANIPPDTVSKSSKNVETSLKINEEGWELPDLSKCEMTEKQVKQKINSPKPVFSNYYRPKVKDLLFTTSLGEMRVLGVREFEIEKRKFCYVIYVTHPLGSRVAGVSTWLTYYDLDGDGKYETKDTKGATFPTIFPE